MFHKCNVVFIFIILTGAANILKMSTEKA